MKQIFLKHNGKEIDQTTYALEYKQGDEILIIYFTGFYAYNKALIYAYDNNVTGYIIYCLTRSRLKISNGLPIKRGRKPSDKKKMPFKVLEVAPDLMKPV
jgi:hypothetical protein